MYIHIPIYPIIHGGGGGGGGGGGVVGWGGGGGGGGWRWCRGWWGDGGGGGMGVVGGWEMGVEGGGMGVEGGCWGIILENQKALSHYLGSRSCISSVTLEMHRNARLFDEQMLGKHVRLRNKSNTDCH